MIAVVPLEPGPELLNAPVIIPLQGLETASAAPPELASSSPEAEPIPQKPVRRQTRLVPLPIEYPEQMDDQSFGEIYRAYFPVVVWFLRKHMYNHALGPYDAETVAQDTFLKLHNFEFERGQHLRSQAALQSWLFKVANSTAIDAMRHESYSAATDSERLSDALECSQPSAEFLSLVDSRHELEPFSELDEYKRYYLWLHYVEEKPVADIAQEMGRPVGTVKAIIHRAKREALVKIRLANDDADND
jgi:RNA polymerase sigma-70 factor, ECF subfamily